MAIKLENKFISVLDEKLNTYGFIKNKIDLKGRVHYVNFKLELNEIVYNLFIRILSKKSEFEVYLEIEYLKLSNIISEIDNTSNKYQHTFTEKLIDFLEEENRDWFINTTSLQNEYINLNDDTDILNLVNYIDTKYIQIVLKEIIPKTNSLDKLNTLLNNYEAVYDKEHKKPKMYVLSGGLIFQSISGLILNTLFDNVRKKDLIEMYGWLFYRLKDDDNVDKIMLGKVMDYVSEKTSV